MAFLFKRPDAGGGTWYVRFRRNGKWVSKSLRTRYKNHAEKELKALRQGFEFVAAEASSRRNDSPDFSYGALAECWNTWATLNSSAAHRRRAAWSLQKFAGVHPDTAPAAVTPMDVESFKAASLEGGLSAKSINNALTDLRAIWNRAERLGVYHGGNPFARAALLPVVRAPVPWLSKTEIERLIWAAALAGDLPLRNGKPGRRISTRNAWIAVHLGLYAGLRKTEIANARWEWVDFERKVLHVQCSDNFQTKSRRNRRIPLHSRLAGALRPFANPAGYLIAPDNPPAKNGQRFDLRKTIERTTAAAGLEGITAHTLVHTFASQLVQAGVSLYKVQEWRGHASATTTQIYAHLEPTGDADIERMG